MPRDRARATGTAVLLAALGACSSYPDGTYGTDGDATAVADFDGDGRAVGSDKSIGYMAANTDGTFADSRPMTTSNSGNVRRIFTADFDGDDRLEIAVAGDEHTICIVDPAP
jgi:hypothetical protein